MENTRIALVTGANQGIGFQISKELAEKGITVLIGSRNLARGKAAAEEIGENAIAVQLDVTDRVSISNAAEFIRKRFGRLDILINNAAISNTRMSQLGGSIEDYPSIGAASVVSLDEVKTVWDTNVFGPLAVYQAMLPLLKEAPHANIVNVSSGVGSLTLNSDPKWQYRAYFGPAYPASKTAMNAMTVAMAIELEGSKIKVNAVTPGYTKTALNNFTGTETVEEGAAEAVRVALLGPDAPHGTLTHATMGVLPW